MEDFILLGQIPGTSIHITFGAWLLSALLLSLTAAWLYDKNHTHRLFFGAVYIQLRLQKRRMIRHFDEIAL